MSTLKKKILISFEEYQLLKKKAELYDKHVISSDKSQIGGASIAEIVAENEFNDGLLGPSTDKTSKNIVKNIIQYIFIKEQC